MRKKRNGILVVLLCVMLLAGNLCAPALRLREVHAEASMKTVKESQYPKLIKGKLTKEQLEWVLEAVTHMGFDGNTKKTVGAKKIDKLAESTIHIVMVMGFESILTNKKEINGHSIDSTYLLTDVNRILSSYSTLRYKAKTDYGGGIVTDADFFYLYGGGFGWNERSEILSAKYDSKKMVIQFRQVDMLSDSVGDSFVATLKKSGKKYVLKKIQRK